jgi:hypothetical protein
VLAAYNITAAAVSFLFVYLDLTTVLVVVPVLLTLVLLYLARCLAQYPENDDPHKAEQYRVPYMPYPPLIGIFVNYFLVAQLEWFGILMIFSYFGLATAVYFIYGVKHSVGNTTGWSALLGETHVSDQDDYSYSTNDTTGLIDGEGDAHDERLHSRHSTQSITDHNRVRLSSLGQSH